MSRTVEGKDRAGGLQSGWSLGGGGRVVWVGGAHSKGRVRGQGCQSGNRWQIGAFQVPPKAYKTYSRTEMRMEINYRLVYSKAKKVLNRGKTRMRNTVFKCEKVEEKDAFFNKMKRTYILIGKRAHRKQNFKTKLRRRIS